MVHSLDHEAAVLDLRVVLLVSALPLEVSLGLLYASNLLCVFRCSMLSLNPAVQLASNEAFEQDIEVYDCVCLDLDVRSKEEAEELSAVHALDKDVSDCRIRIALAEGFEAGGVGYAFAAGFGQVLGKETVFFLHVKNFLNDSPKVVDVVLCRAFVGFLAGSPSLRGASAICVWLDHA